MQNKIFKQIFETISKSQNILLVTHVNPDADGLSALLSLYIYLKKINKDVEMFVNDELPKNYNFLPYLNLIKKDFKNLSNSKFDLVIVLDCAGFDRSGLKNFLSHINYSPDIINIDHHLTNDNFGKINLVNSQASSSCEILFEFFQQNKIILNEKLAHLLMLGIIGDTDFFVNPNTSPRTLKISAELVKAGAKLPLIFNKIYQQSKVSKLKLWGKALSRLEIDSQTQLATTVIFQEDLEFDFDESALDGLANFLNSLGDEAKGVLVLKEEMGQKIKGNLRTTNDNLDVSKIAKEYGGGGHKKAAGFQIQGKIIKNKKGEWEIER